MKKILLVSYYFTPCTLTPSQRITYWGRNLANFGYRPTIVTREWKEDIKTHADTKLPLGREIRFENHDDFDVYYLPFRPGILDSAYLKWGESRFRPLFYLVRLLDIILVYFSLRFTSFKNFEPFIKGLIKRDQYDFMIISGEPFYLFKIGYSIKKKFGLNWIADYRDDWTTNELQKVKSDGLLRKIIHRVEKLYEKSWVSTTSLIISVSDVYSKRLGDFLKKPTLTIANGFEESILKLPDQKLFDDFTVVYSGTLYPSQDISIILKTLEKSIDSGFPFRLIFLGSGFDIKEVNRLNKIINPKLKPYIEITERMPRDQALNYLQKAHVLLGISYQNLKGIPSSKLYEYIGLRKPVLLCPSDNDIMHYILNDVGLGFFSQDSDSCLNKIMQIRGLYESGEIESIRRHSMSKIGVYSRKGQLLRFKSFLDDYK
ncbi:hypothetical protein [Penaeicola halotolerans]|uniref:hypothetical protein n=1 Tax=Penaeicola halotolerans TaxID=2793196 RepID=UPI001CF89779|nr:hypothetical protein [Penaeicola halotolerans]